MNEFNEYNEYNEDENYAGYDQALNQENYDEQEAYQDNGEYQDNSSMQNNYQNMTNNYYEQQTDTIGQQPYVDEAYMQENGQYYEPPKEVEPQPQQNMYQSNIKEELTQKAEQGKKTIFKYEVINSLGEKEKGSLEAYRREDVISYLTHEGYEIVKVDVSKDIVLGTSKMKLGELSFLLTQLSTYLKAGIPLIDSVRILEKQSTKANQKRIFANMIYELVKGESFSNTLASQGNTFPNLLINMVKTAEMTGDLPSTLDDMAEYYTSIDKTRKQVVSAMTYPIIVFIFALMVIVFILLYIIPEFKSLFEQNGAVLPGITRFTLGVSDFIANNYIIILAILSVVGIVYHICYKKIRAFRGFMQNVFMKLPVVKDIIIYNEVAMFTKTFASLLNHNVFITDTMAILSQVSSNVKFSDIINRSLDYLARGAKISDAFKGERVFPIVAYEMLVTGENTGRLPQMMGHVADYYQELHANMVKRITTFIEPLMIIFLAVIVGTVILSVILPMFSFYGQIQ